MNLRANLARWLERRDLSKALTAVIRGTKNAGCVRTDDRLCLGDDCLIIAMAINF